MPVYNGEQFIREALDSLLAQTETNFELIISDNASTDKTEQICLAYAAHDHRINYVRQLSNMGAAANFKFVFDQARGEYFMWTACDDVRSPDFIEQNYKFLSENSEYVASTSPNTFEGKGLNDGDFVTFSLDGDWFERCIQFFDHCWISHGIFYALVRTDILRGCEVIGQSFIAADWAIDLYMASKGKIHRVQSGYMVSGNQGVSNSAVAFKAFRNHAIELIFPFYRLTQYVTHLIAGMSLKQQIRIFSILLKLNLFAVSYPLRCALKPLYHAAIGFR